MTFDKEIWFARGPRFGNPWMSWMRGGDALGHDHHGDSVQRFARYRRPSKPVYHPKQISCPNLLKLSSKTTTANEVSCLRSFSPWCPQSILAESTNQRGISNAPESAFPSSSVTAKGPTAEGEALKIRRPLQRVHGVF